VTAETLHRCFSLTRKEAREIVTQCQNCCEFLPVPHVGINPRGLKPLQVWQMDVTHISSFGRFQYLHVSIDTCSGIIFAMPLTGEKASHVIQHCLEAWSAWGQPEILKTDNGPAYTSQKFLQFCHQRNVTHLTGLPYNPLGQGIVERAHHTLKSYLIKQKGGVEEALPSVPRVAVSMALLIFKILMLKAILRLNITVQNRITQGNGKVERCLDRKMERPGSYFNKIQVSYTCFSTGGR
jgi:transposase InsO family protein